MTTFAPGVLAQISLCKSWLWISLHAPLHQPFAIQSGSHQVVVPILWLGWVSLICFFSLAAICNSVDKEPPGFSCIEHVFTAARHFLPYHTLFSADCFSSMRLAQDFHRAALRSGLDLPGSG